MPFSNPVVGGTALVRTAINSPNYQTGVAGWSINQDGSAEFNNVNVRGTFSIPNNNPGTPRFVISPNIPTSLSPITNGDPVIWNGRSIIAALLYYGTGNDFSFIGLQTSGGLVRIVTGRAANSTSGSLVSIIRSDIYDNNTPSFGAETVLYNYISISSNNGRAGSLSVDNSAFTNPAVPLSWSFKDGNGTARSIVPGLMALGSGQGGSANGAGNQVLTGTETLLAMFPPNNAIVNYPFRNNTSYVLMGQLACDCSATPVHIIMRIRQQVGGSPVPATDPILGACEMDLVNTGLTSTNSFSRLLLGLNGVFNVYATGFFIGTAGTHHINSQVGPVPFGGSWYGIFDAGTIT